jgi:thiosulfate reductase cytochrome b subunit
MVVSRTPARQSVQHHSLPVRIAHWLMAASVLIMIASGWRIYNASPIFVFRFPEVVTLGGDIETALARHNDPGVATAIAWLFAAMWLLLLSYIAFVAWGAGSGHFRRAVQKAFYWGVVLDLLLMLVSGLAIWKPVQTWPLEVLFGGFQGARIVHFLGMAAISLFLIVHVALVILVPKTFVAMITGRATETAR